MALVLRDPEVEADFVLRVRQNMVRRNLPPPFPGPIRRERGLSVEDVELVDPIPRGPDVVPLDGPSGPLLDCLGTGGETVLLEGTVGLGGTVVIAEGPISRPFLITHVFAYHNSGNGTPAEIGVKVSSDNVTTGGFDTPGDFILFRSAARGTVDPGDRGLQVYPNKLIREFPRFLKAIYLRGPAGEADFGVYVSIVKF